MNGPASAHNSSGTNRNAEMAAAAGERGVPVIQADFHDVSGEYDVVLFTRSLHHAENLDDILAHAATLLAPAGQVIIEEFAREQVNHAAARFLYDNRALLVATGMLDAELPSGALARRLGKRPRHPPPRLRHARRPEPRRLRSDHSGHAHAVALGRQPRRCLDRAGHPRCRRLQRHPPSRTTPPRRWRIPSSRPPRVRPPVMPPAFD
ncbi:methyltransferase domain-containing protein [Amycolatopsis sp. H20-H5]|uniref:methyltransferase domain-containing protein n=1 Tax=Amycolatopsis sp. H20-H5 TaxID=3046309 RepID=UPI003FA359D9